MRMRRTTKQTSRATVRTVLGEKMSNGAERGSSPAEASAFIECLFMAVLTVCDAPADEKGRHDGGSAGLGGAARLLCMQARSAKCNASFVCMAREREQHTTSDGLATHARSSTYLRAWARACWCCSCYSSLKVMAMTAEGTEGLAPSSTKAPRCAAPCLRSCSDGGPNQRVLNALLAHAAGRGARGWVHTQTFRRSGIA